MLVKILIKLQERSNKLTPENNINEMYIISMSLKFYDIPGTTLNNLKKLLFLFCVCFTIPASVFLLLVNSRVHQVRFSLFQVQVVNSIIFKDY